MDAPKQPQGQRTSGAKGCKTCIHMCTSTHMGACVQPHILLLRRDLRSTSTWTHRWAVDFRLRCTVVVARPYLAAHPHGRTHGQWASASGPLLLLHSHTCEHIHMDAHVGKGLQLQVHCCCCTAMLRSTSTWTHTWAMDFSFRPIDVVAQPYLGAHPHGRTHGQGASASGPLLLLHSHA